MTTSVNESTSRRDEELGDYDPFKDRKLEHPTTDLDTLIHLLKGSLGSGILAMPMAFANAGLFFGLFCILIIGVICTYCVHILVKSAHVLCRRHRIPALSFAEVAETSFLTGPPKFHPWAKFAKGVINFFLVVDLLGCCCCYILFVAENIKQVVDIYTPKHTHQDIEIYMACLLFPLIVVNLIRNLKLLAPFSLVANVLIATSMAITFYYLMVDIPPISSVKPIVEIVKLPKFFGTAIFALEAIGVVMSLENNMETPTHFIGCPGVLNIGMSFVVILYATTGFFGYLKYGPDTMGSITLNLPQNQGLGQSVKLMIAVAIFFTYALQFYVPVEIIWKSTKHHFAKRPVLAECNIRICLVILTVVLSIMVPNLGAFISLIGALCLSMLGLIFPAIIHILTFHDDLGRFRWKLYKNIFLIVFGLIGFVTGTWVSVEEILVSQFSKK